MLLIGSSSILGLVASVLGLIAIFALATYRDVQMAQMFFLWSIAVSAIAITILLSWIATLLTRHYHYEDE